MPGATPKRRRTRASATSKTPAPKKASGTTAPPARPASAKAPRRATTSRRAVKGAGARNGGGAGATNGVSKKAGGKTKRGRAAAAAAAAEQASAPVVDAAALAVHRCRFVDFVPSAIQCVAFDSTGTLLAVARASGDVEVWSPNCSWSPFLRVCVSKDAAPRCIAWAPATASAAPRLFAGGLNGEVFEVNLANSCVKHVTSSYGGAVWSMALKPTANEDGTRVLALGCEDGAVRLFHIDPHGSGIEYERSMPGSDARVLSVAWHPTEDVLFSGTANGTILGWDVAARRAEVRIQVEALGSEATLVWALVVLSDFTVVSGDSLGHVQIWDGRMGTLVHSFSQHKADVLALAATNAGVIPEPPTGAAGSTSASSRRPRSLKVFSAGMDGLVAAVRRVTSAGATSTGHAAGVGVPAASSECRWVKAGAHHAHSHDVMSVAVSASGVVATGGLDSQLCVVDTADVGHRQPRKYGPFPSWPVVSTACEPRMLLVQQHTRVEVWRLKRVPVGGAAAAGAGSGAGAGATATVAPAGPGHVVASQVSAQPEELLLTLHARDEAPLISSALSPGGEFLALSDSSSVRLYALNVTDGLKPTRVELPSMFTAVPGGRRGVPGLTLAFTPLQPRLIVGSSKSRIFVVDIHGDAKKGFTATLGHEMSPPTVQTKPTRAQAASDSDSDSDSDGDSGSDNDSGDDSGSDSGSGDEADSDGDDTSDEGSGDNGGSEQSNGAAADASAGASGAVSVPSQLMHQLSRGVSRLAVSGDGQWLAASDLWNDVHIYSLDALKFHLSLPRLPALVTAMAFHHSSPFVAITTTDNSLSVYNAESGRLAPWSIENAGRLPERFRRKAATDPVRHVTFNPGTSLLVMAGHAYLGVVDIDKVLCRVAAPCLQAAESSHVVPVYSVVEQPMKVETASSRPHKKSRRNAAGAAASTPAENNFRVVTRYGPTLFTDFVSHDEMVIVEVPWVRAVQHLPAALYRKRYGV